MAFETSVTIDRPAAEVFAFLTDVANETQWQENLVEVRLASPGPIGVGSRGEDTRRQGSRLFLHRWTCTELEPDRTFARKVTTPVPFRERYQLEPVDGGGATKVTMSARPTVLSLLLWPLVGSASTRQSARDLATLKRVLEA